MKLLGITAEYNPFHNGHAYHIREAKARTGCDSLVVLMSGDFTQRGTPAITDKYVRAEAALRNGADIVIELPVYSATASAEGFAEGAVRAFAGLGVDAVSYGIECGRMTEETGTQNADSPNADPDTECSDESLTKTASRIRAAAAFFAEEPEEFRTLLKEGLSSGLSYPAARQNAYCALNGEDASFLSTPNNILAIEYEKAMIRLGSAMKSVPVARIGSGYHDTDSGRYASATAIRAMIEGNCDVLSEVLSEPLSEPLHGAISEAFPENLNGLYENAFRHPVFPDDLSSVLYAAVHGRTAEELAQYSDISDDTAKRLAEASKRPFTWTSLTEALRERSHTLTHVNRALCHILLGITKDNEQRYRTSEHLPYLHVLGIRKEASPLLGQLADRSPAPLLVRLQKDMRSLSPEARELFETDLNATALYSHIRYGKGVPAFEERTRKFLVV